MMSCARETVCEQRLYGRVIIGQQIKKNNAMCQSKLNEQKPKPCEMTVFIQYTKFDEKFNRNVNIILYAQNYF